MFASHCRDVVAAKGIDDFKIKAVVAKLLDLKVWNIDWVIVSTWAKVKMAWLVAPAFDHFIFRKEVKVPAVIGFSLVGKEHLAIADDGRSA